MADPQLSAHCTTTTERAPTDGGMQRSQSHHDFQAQTSHKHLERLEKARKREGTESLVLQQLFLGLAATNRDNHHVDVGFAAHDGTYSVDFAVHSVELNGGNVGDVVTDYIIESISQYQKEHRYKFVGAGITRGTRDMCPELLSRLWRRLDIVALVFETKLEASQVSLGLLSVDEAADSMARKCVRFFGPTMQPYIMIGFRNEVEVDCAGHAMLATVEDYQRTVSPRTWAATMNYVDSIKARNVKIAFFNATPQGGGVALMRHALVRFLRLVGVNIKWFVPRPKPEVFRITKTNHNILQGVARPEERLTKEQIYLLDEWSETNARRSWSGDGGPLASRSKGGADFVVVDDPQMPNLVALAKKADASRPVIFRSHIQVRSDLADTEGTPTAEVWQWIHGLVREADMFVSHPVKVFVPKDVNPSTVGYLPATTDWLDGLNKEMRSWDMRFYLHEFNESCRRQGLQVLQFPKRDYMVQIARFDPSKGIPHVLASYAKLRREHFKDGPIEKTPQLVIAGHGSIDDPDGTMVFDQLLDSLEHEYKDISEDVVTLRVGPTDQILNALMSGAKVALQLSTREGFEVKVSEALHKGIPIIASRAGGIPLQVEDGKSGFVVEPSDHSAIAKHLYELFTDNDLYRRMSEYAATHVSDEVSTVGNALSWLYLADSLTRGEKIEPNGAWINDIARRKAGLDYIEGETRLPRHLST